MREIYETLNIKFVQLIKLKRVKKYNEKSKRSIIYVIYLFMTIFNHTKNLISLIITHLKQHDVILKKS